MLALEIRFLTGRYAASRHDDAEQPEWPPHPARVYSALTAALHEVGNDPPEDERAALEWLSSAGAPDIIAPHMSPRHIGTVFVPVNDPKALDSIDKPLLAIADLEREIDAADENARARIEKRLRRAEQKLEERSKTTARASRSAPESGRQLLERPRHPRFFPVAVPTSDAVHMLWHVDAPADMRATLDSICARVSRLGHSSSLVGLRLLDAPVDPPGGCERWVPDPEGVDFIRVPHEQQLRLLEDAFSVHRATAPRVLPARSARYSRLQGTTQLEDLSASEFASSAEDWLIFEVVPGPEERRRRLLDVSLTQTATRALRGALLSAVDGDAPEILSGHDPDGRPATSTHVALLSLADLGHQHATGSILGLAIVPPRAIDGTDRDRLLEAVFRSEQASGDPGHASVRGGIRLTLGRRGVLHLRRLREPSHVRTLSPGRWCQPARRWTTVTAVALDRNPGKLLSTDPEAADRALAAAERTISQACTRIGLPEPSAVWVHRRSLVKGAPPARRFAPYPDGGSGPRRVCVHAEILFDRPVRGPVVLGAGRYYGVGLAVPHERRKSDAPR